MDGYSVWPPCKHRLFDLTSSQAWITMILLSIIDDFWNPFIDGYSVWPPGRHRLFGLTSSQAWATTTFLRIIDDFGRLLTDGYLLWLFRLSWQGEKLLWFCCEISMIFGTPWWMVIQFDFLASMCYYDFAKNYRWFLESLDWWLLGLTSSQAWITPILLTLRQLMDGYSV